MCHFQFKLQRCRKKSGQLRDGKCPTQAYYSSWLEWILKYVILKTSTSILLKVGSIELGVKIGEEISQF